MTTFRLEPSSSVVSSAEAESIKALGFEFEAWDKTGNWVSTTKKEVTVELDDFPDLFEFLKKWDAVLSVDNKGPFIIINYWE